VCVCFSTETYTVLYVFQCYGVEVKLDCILILLSTIEITIVNIAALFTPVKGTVTIVLKFLHPFSPVACRPEVKYC